MTAGETAAATATLRMTRHFQASPEALFDAFTERDLLVQWFGPRGMAVPECEIDLSPGGRWRAVMRAHDGSPHAVHGVYREITRPTRLVFTWIWEQGDMAGVETVVTLAFRAAGDGAELSLTHEGLPSESSRGLHEQGWSSSFECLAELLAGRA